MIRYYTKNLLTCSATYVGAAVLCIAMLTSMIGQRYTGALLYEYQYSNTLGIAVFFAPVVTVLPICYIRREMLNKEVWHMVLLRSSPLRYCIGGLLGSVVSGALVAILASLGFLLFCVLVLGGPVNLKVSLFNGTEPFYAGKSGELLLLIRVLVHAANGALWASVAYAVSAFTGNTYISAAAPSLLNILAGYITQHFGWTYADPSQLTLTGNALLFPYGGLIYAGSYILLVIIVCGLLFYLRLRRRLCHG